MDLKEPAYSDVVSFVNKMKRHYNAALDREKTEYIDPKHPIPGEFLRAAFNILSKKAEEENYSLLDEVEDLDSFL